MENADVLVHTSYREATTNVIPEALGMDIVQEMTKVATGNAGPHGDVPKEDVLIKSAEVV